MTLAETRRGWGGGGGGGVLRNMLRWPWVTLAETRRGGEREILAVVTQSDLSRSHVSWPGGGGGGGRDMRDEEKA